MEANGIVQTVSLSEINNLKSGYYFIKRSQSPHCIYKLLTIDPDKELRFYTNGSQSSGWYGGNSSNDRNVWTAEVLGQDEQIHQTQRSDAHRIELLVEHPQVLPAKDGYNSCIKIVNSGTAFMSTARTLQIDISRSYNNTEKAKLVEKDDQFYASYYGVCFPASTLRYNYNGRDPLQTNDPYKLKEYLNDFKGHVEFTDRDQMNRFLVSQMVDKNDFSRFAIKETDGVMKTLVVIKSLYESVVSKDVLASIAFKEASDNIKKAIGGLKFSVIFNRLFAGITTEAQFTAKLAEMSAVLEDKTKMYLDTLVDSIPEARELKKAALKRKATGAFNKIMDDLEYLTLDKDKFPITHEAIYSGTLPKGVFFRQTGESYFVYNDNWELWEEMLRDYPTVALEIAVEVARRTTYEKDIMSYFYFVLRRLPQYLEKFTGKKWKGIPKLILDVKEPEAPEEGKSTTKTRSALTPIVDNENNTVTVPYVSMQIGGYQTTYCYGLDYQILTEGFSFKGNVVTKNIERKLNGRDDYGLMFYTFTGTAQGRGYPTFLIIFERRDNKTEVHFHRTHPMRSKNGEYNPVHDWTAGCYRWMVGNVSKERTKAQQGDLAFVETTSPLDGAFTTVDGYDNHKFETPVQFLPYEKKDKANILGYVRLTDDNVLTHPEHMNRLVPAGDYEIRQCRSWEANPKGIWSLRID